MNDRSTALLLIAVALARYGVYIAGYVPAMLLGQPWAAGVVVLLGVSIAVLALVVALIIAAYVNRQHGLRMD